MREHGVWRIPRTERRNTPLWWQLIKSGLKININQLNLSIKIRTAAAHEHSKDTKLKLQTNLVFA